MCCMNCTALIFTVFSKYGTVHASLLRWYIYRVMTNQQTVRGPGGRWGQPWRISPLGAECRGPGVLGVVGVPAAWYTGHRWVGGHTCTGRRGCVPPRWPASGRHRDPLRPAPGAAVSPPAPPWPSPTPVWGRVPRPPRPLRGCGTRWGRCVWWGPPGKSVPGHGHPHVLGHADLTRATGCPHPPAPLPLWSARAYTHTYRHILPCVLGFHFIFFNKYYCI